MEVHKGRNDVTRAERVLASCIDQNVLGKVHNFREVDRTTQSESRNLDFPDDLYFNNAVKAQESLDLRQIIFGARTPWWSPGPGYFAAPQVDLELQDFLIPKNRLKEARTAWYSLLVPNGCRVIMRADKPEDYGNEFFLALTNACSQMTVAWPLEKLTDSLGEAFVPKYPPSPCRTSCKLLAVVNTKDWSLAVVAFDSPCRTRLRVAQANLLFQPEFVQFIDKIRIRAVGDFVPLLRFAAEDAFSTVPEHIQKKLAAELDPPLDLSMLPGEFSALKVLVRRCLPDRSDLELLKVLQKPIIAAEYEADDDIFHSELLADCFDAHDREDVLQACRQSKDNIKAMATYQKDFEEHSKKVKGIKGKVAASTSSKNSPFYKMKFGVIPAGAITQPEAKLLLPPGAYVWIGKNGTWWTHLAPHKRCVKEWDGPEGYTHHEACMYVIRDAWRLFLKDNHMTQEQCPVPGLF